MEGHIIHKISDSTEPNITIPPETLEYIKSAKGEYESPRVRGGAEDIHIEISKIRARCLNRLWVAVQAYVLGNYGCYYHDYGTKTIRGTIPLGILTASIAENIAGKQASKADVSRRICKSCAADLFSARNPEAVLKFMDDHRAPLSMNPPDLSFDTHTVFDLSLNLNIRVKEEMLLDDDPSQSSSPTLVESWTADIADPEL